MSNWQVSKGSKQGFNTDYPEKQVKPRITQRSIIAYDMASHCPSRAAKLMSPRNPWLNLLLRVIRVETLLASSALPAPRFRELAGLLNMLVNPALGMTVQIARAMEMRH
jgi:hypothetical protein